VGIALWQIAEDYSSRTCSKCKHLNKVVDRSDQEWLSKELPSLLHAAGIRFAATVIPQSPTAQLSNRNILRNLKEGEFAKETFSSLEEAKAWLCAE
jgi:hypothetical protein